MILEGPGGGVSYDAWFKDEIMPKLRKRGLLPGPVGGFIGGGFEALVYKYSSDQVIRFQPTYEEHPSTIEQVYQRQLNAPSGPMYVQVTDVGKIDGYDEEMGQVTYAVYTIMEELDPIDDGDAEMIDAVVTKHADLEDAHQKLSEFLKVYIELPIDQDSRNVMMRGDEYVIIDPE